MTPVTEEQYTQLVRPRQQLWWWVKDTRNLSLEKVVEGILTRGTLDEIRLLFNVLGKEKVKSIFLMHVSSKRHNYKPKTVNFLKLVFSDVP